MKNKELIQRLRDNSSGIYRSSREGANRLELALYLLGQIKNSLPQKRDWLDPDIEKSVDRLLELNKDLPK